MCFSNTKTMSKFWFHDRKKLMKCMIQKGKKAKWRALLVWERCPLGGFVRMRILYKIVQLWFCQNAKPKSIHCFSYPWSRMWSSRSSKHCKWMLFAVTWKLVVPSSKAACWLSCNWHTKPCKIRKDTCKTLAVTCN